VTPAKAGTQAVPVSDFLTALTATLCAASARWSGTSNTKPLSAALYAQLLLPSRLQLTPSEGVGTRALAPSITLPGVVSCRRRSTELLPAGMLIVLPSGHDAAPLAVKLPVTPSA